MATNEYMSGRKKYQRPQALLFSENPGVIDNGSRVPIGYESGTNTTSISNQRLLDQFMILSDDNRQPIDVKILRIENRERMVNGRMRSHHIADKRSLSISWTMLPSRSFSSKPNFSISGGETALGVSGSPTLTDNIYTTDGGAGGVELKDWYDRHKGSFWVFIAYDNYKELGLSHPNNVLGTLQRYNEVVEMYITDFNYSVQKRGGTNYDLWNVSMTLEEV
jgi:hypothetical protein